MKKQLKLDKRAEKEIFKFPQLVQAKFAALFVILEQDGFLYEPNAKRINEDLFELRVRYRGQWRVVYAYIGKLEIIILSGFQKKTQKMPENEIKKALQRLKSHKGDT